MLINCDVLIGYLLINIGGSSVFIGSAYVADLLIVISTRFPIDSQILALLSSLSLTWSRIQLVLFAFVRLVVLLSGKEYKKENIIST